jgi:RNA polymerase sigma factor (sigma-70 family)
MTSISSISSKNEDLETELNGASIDTELQATGFIGKAYIYDEEVFVDTTTGEGYDTVIKHMRGYIDWYSGKIRLAGFEREDIKQLIVMILLDGIRRYNPGLKIAGQKIRLSTFLYVHLKNRIITRIKEETKQSSNANYNEIMYRFICPCGASYRAHKYDAPKKTCDSCKMNVGNFWKIRPDHYEPMSLDSVLENTEDGEGFRVQYTGHKSNVIDFFGRVDEAEDAVKDMDFHSVLKKEDPTTRKIADLIYTKDYSITDAAKEVGLSCWATSLRLKRLKDKKHIKEYFLEQ